MAKNNNKRKNGKRKKRNSHSFQETFAKLHKVYKENGLLDNESISSGTNSQNVSFVKDDLNIENKKLASSSSVKAHRERLKKLGFKQVSIYLPPDIYKKLKYLKLHTNKSYADLISQLINEEFNKFKKRRDIPILDFDDLLNKN